MIVYSDLDSLYKDIEDDVKYQLRIIAKQIKEDIKDYINDYIYKEYTPTVYQRTYELLNSCKVTPVRKIDGEWYVEIYIKESIHEKKTNWHDEERTFSDIIEMFEKGEAKWRNGEVKTFSLAEDEWVMMEKALSSMMAFLKNKYDVIIK